jgi:hypothetical protein
LISPQKLELLAGLLMLVLGGLLGFQVLQGWGLIAWLAF